MLVATPPHLRQGPIPASALANSRSAGNCRPFPVKNVSPNAIMCLFPEKPVPRPTKIAVNMPLIDQVQKDMVAAMKAKDEARLSALRMIKAGLMKQKVDSPKPVDEAAEMQLMKQLIKQRIDAAEMFRKGGREEQALKEEAEKAIIESYLPAGASDAEVDAAIAEAIAETGATSIKQMGAVMKAAQARLQGKTVDGKSLSDKVKSKLS